MLVTWDDPALPQLTRVLDPELMAGEFSRYLWGERSGPDADRYAIKGCQIEHVRYKPRRGCAICYRLRIHDRSTKSRWEQLVLARVYGAGAALHGYEKALLRPMEATRGVPALSHIAPLEMVVWAFPNERKMRYLGALTDSDRLNKEILPEVVRARWGSQQRIVEATHRLMHYAPEHTLSIRVDLQLRHCDKEERRAWVLFGKTYYDRQGWDTYSLMRRLWKYSWESGGLLRMPRPVSYQSRLKALWQEGLPGIPLLAALERGTGHVQAFFSAGVQVGALHMSDVTCGNKLRIEDFLERLTNLESMLHELNLPARAKVPLLVRRLVDGARSLGPMRQGVLHGDLHAQNLLVHKGCVSLIDFDNVRRGPTLYDIGSFVSSLLYRGLLVEGRPEAHLSQLQAFMSGYSKQTTAAISPAQLNWMVAVTLLTERVYRSISRLKCGRLGLIDEIVRLADAVQQNEVDFAG
jgi:hypothetical protein